MHDLFSAFFGPGGDGDRIFSWLWPIFVVGYMIGFSLFGTPDLWGFKTNTFSGFLFVSGGFGTATTLVLFALGTVVSWFLDRFEK